MKRLLLLVMTLSLIFSFADGQLWKAKRYEVSAGIGPSQFFSDIGGYSRSENVLGFKDLTIKHTRFSSNINIRYRVTQEFNARVGFSYGFLRATDARGSNIAREFEAKTSIFEQNLIGEYYFIRNRAERSYNYMKGRGFGRSIASTIDVYGFTGIGGALYSVKPNDQLALRIVEDKGYALTIPVGVGFSFAFSPTIKFGLEFAGRYAFSDYLDGYSSQYSSSNDVYYFLNATVTYKMRTNSKGWPTLALGN